MVRFAPVTRLALVVLATGCSEPPRSRPSTSIEDAGGFDFAKMNAAIGACAVDSYKGFKTAADALAATSSDRVASRAKWIAANDAWQVAELFAIGPLAATSLPGGEGERDAFYAWPTSARCSIDEALVAKTYETADYAKSAAPAARGMGALEYLLFYEGTTNACGSTSKINAEGTWSALSKDELDTRRLAYAKVLETDLGTRAQALIDKWQGGFLASFTSAGQGSAVFPTEKSALTAINEALFYVEFMTKDRKVGVPIGIDPAACAEPPCGELLEAILSKQSKTSARTNLVAFRKLFRGCGADFSGTSVDDLLIGVGAKSLAEEIDGLVVAAIASLDAIPDATFDEALARDPNALKPLYDALKKLTDALRTDFVSVLSLSLPARVAGDND